MAFIRTCFVTAVMLFCVLFPNAQTVGYPARSSQLLKSTAADIAMLLKKAVDGSQFTIEQYSTVPAMGIIFIYDSTIIDNQACNVESDGATFISFTAAQDNGLCLGVYQYLQDLGFRFYQPGTAWEIIPPLSSAYKKMSSSYSGAFKYNTWSVSGGYSRWVMDLNSDYNWDKYGGENGHSWALYQRRNGMLGESRFEGHRSGIITGSNLPAWQSNPCFIANNNNSRAITGQSVPDVQSPAAMDLWASGIEQKYTTHRNSMFSNINLYVNQVRNFNYDYQNIGIEVPDGARWGNSRDNIGCVNNGYAKESDQHFTLANHTVQKISTIYPAARFQLYAYSAHADIPSGNIAINEKIDIQLVPAVYQNLTSTNGLRNRWYKRTKNISEYNYLNLSGWSGETPGFYLDDFKATLQIAKDNQSQGLVWEASPAKFASLPYLFAANKNLHDNISVDSALKEFCSNMFTVAGGTIYNLLQFWTDSKNLGGGISNRYKLPMYFKMIKDAENQIAQEPAIVKERLHELKAYLHYMVLYYDWAGDPRSANEKQDKAAAVCIYLAKTNKLQLVNSYYLVAGITARYANTSAFYQQYNKTNGTAYQNGTITLITAEEIEADFGHDFLALNGSINNYRFESVEHIANSFDDAGLTSQENIQVKLTYTNGMDNYNRTEYFIKAEAPGSFTINYKPSFDTPGMGYLNFTVESTDKALEVIEDLSLDNYARAGSIKIVLPVAGNYKLTISSKFKTSAEIEIITNKNKFYKQGAFFGKTTELYQNNIGIPGYFYIPDGIDKVYFSLGNSYSNNTGYATAEKISNGFAFQDHNGKELKVRFVTPNDSTLFYIDIPRDAAGKFCRATKKINYDLIFSNISNYLWYARPKPKSCGNTDFSQEIINQNGDCIVRLTARSVTAPISWQVTDLGKTVAYGDQTVLDLPVNTTPDAQVSLITGPDCRITKKIGDDEHYKYSLAFCGNGAAEPEILITPIVYPNPTTGNFKAMQHGAEIVADQLIIYNVQGNAVARFDGTSQFNIGSLAGGVYWYQIIIKGRSYSGKLVKL
ncbi:MAG: T9SS type A sorting domain-containing protein [Ferruginibacter sp.]